jgi:hypothetical protein
VSFLSVSSPVRYRQNSRFHRRLPPLSSLHNSDYFGYAPTCRCQESFRFYYTQVITAEYLSIISRLETPHGAFACDAAICRHCCFPVFDILICSFPSRFLIHTPSNMCNAIKLFQRHTRFREVEWFLFMDDDIYLRPHALMAMLQTYTANLKPVSHHSSQQSSSSISSMSSGAVSTSSLVSSGAGSGTRNSSSSSYRGGSISGRSSGRGGGSSSGRGDGSMSPVVLASASACTGYRINKVWKKEHGCSRFTFPVLMPALFNLPALEVLRPAIEANGSFAPFTRCRHL